MGDSINGTDIFGGNAGVAQQQAGITTKTFVLNLAVGIGLFAIELSIFFLLKSSNLGRRILCVNLLRATPADHVYRQL